MHLIRRETQKVIYLKTMTLSIMRLYANFELYQTNHAAYIMSQEDQNSHTNVQNRYIIDLYLKNRW